MDLSCFVGVPFTLWFVNTRCFPKLNLTLTWVVTEYTNLGSLCKQKLGFFRETIWLGEKKQMDMVIRQRRE